MGEEHNHAYDKKVLDQFVRDITALKKNGHAISLVVGGGNLFRGPLLTETIGIERSTGDYVGMLATVQNALVLRDYFELNGIQTRVLSAIAMPQICESYMPQRAKRHLEKDRVVIFAAGLGAPYFTTDSTAVQRALEMKMDILVAAKNGVDAVYSADPKKDSGATRFEVISASNILERNLKVFDLSAIAMAKEHHLNIKVVGIPDISRALESSIGTTITPS
jgi:uridylate kinase